MLQINFYEKLQQNTISSLLGNINYLKFCEIIGDDMNNLQKVCEYFLNSRDLDKAEGIWLDYIGWLVGTSRQYFDISKYFRVNVPDVNVEKFIYFKTSSESGESNLNDILFRQRIKSKIGYNITKGTRKENNFIIKNMTFANNVIIKRVEPMVLDIKLIGNNILQTPNLKKDIEYILGTGVGIRNLEIIGA